MSGIDQALVVRLEASMRQFERSMERGRTIGARTATGLQRQFDETNRRIGRSSASAARGISGLANISGSSRFVLQNTAAQIGDMAVQLESGTAASRVMAQQLPQLFGGFGALGGVLGVAAPLLGTIAAIGIPVAAALWGMSRGGDAAEEGVRTFVERLGDAEGAIDRAGDAAARASAGGLDEVRETYGEITQEIQNMLDEMARMERQSAVVEVRGVLDEAFGDEFQTQIDNLFGGVGAMIVEADPERLQRARDEIAFIEAELQELMSIGAEGTPLFEGLTRDLARAREDLAALTGEWDALGSLGEGLISPDLLFQISDLKTALDDAVSAERFADVLPLADQLRAALQLAASEAGEMTPELQAALDALTRAQDISQRFAAKLGDASVTADELSGSLSEISESDLDSIIDQAGRLADQLELSALEADRFVRSWARVAAMGLRGNTSTDGVGARDPDDPRSPGFSGPIWDGPTNTNPVPWSDRPPPSTGGSGRGSGGGGGSAATAATQDHTAAIQAQVDALRLQIDALGMTSAETARLRAERGALSVAQRAGADLDAVNAETGRTLREEIALQADQVGRLTERLEQGQVSWQAYQRGVKSIADAMAGAIVQSKNMGDAIRNVFRQMAQSWISNGISRILNGLGGAVFGGGGVLGGVLGGIFGAGMTGKAIGGSVQAGGIYPINENTPNTEYFAPSVSGAVLTPKQVQDGMSRGVAKGGGAAEVLVRLAVPAGVTVEESIAIANGVTVRVLGQYDEASREMESRA